MNELQSSLGPHPSTIQEPRVGNPRMLVISIVGGSVVMLLLLIGVMASAWSLMGGGFGGGPAASNLRDYREAPVEAWVYDYRELTIFEHASEEPGFRVASDNGALLWTRVGSLSSKYGDSEWHEGYAEEYDLGYERGIEYSRAMDRWYRSSTAEYPEYEDFVSSTAGRGFYDGFDDGGADRPHGYSALNEPRAHEYESLVVMLDTKTGEERWRTNLSEHIPFDDLLTLAIDVAPAGDRALVQVHETHSGTVSLLTLNLNNGQVVSQRTITADSVGPVEETYHFHMITTSLAGDRLVMALTNDIERVISAYRLDALDGSPLWEHAPVYPDVDFSLQTVNDNYVIARHRIDDANVTEVLQVANGEGAEWGDDLSDYDYYTVSQHNASYGTVRTTAASSDEVAYYDVDGALLRLDRSGSVLAVARTNWNGERVWDRELLTDISYIGGGMIFTADEIRGSSSSGGLFFGLQRVNPANGEPMWKTPYGEDFVGVAAILDDTVVLLDDRQRLVVLDARNGEERHSMRSQMDYPFGVAGQTMFYQTDYDELTGYSVRDPELTWKFRLREGQHVQYFGSTFGVVDTERRTVSGLE